MNFGGLEQSLSGVMAQRGWIQHLGKDQSVEMTVELVQEDRFAF